MVFFFCGQGSYYLWLNVELASRYPDVCWFNNVDDDELVDLLV